MLPDYYKIKNESDYDNNYDYLYAKYYLNL